MHDKMTQAFRFHSQDLPFTDSVGIGLRTPHYEDIIEHPPSLGWLEIHPENYFGGGLHRHYLTKIRENFPLSLHAVGLSLGADQAVNVEHLRQIKELIDLYEPFMVSDHAAWSASGNAHLNDLLPLPYTHETVTRLCDNIDQTQTYFGRKILIENPSTYLDFHENEMHEYELLNVLCAKTGCGILLDINNIYVQSHNHGIDPREYIDNVNPAYVGEMHLAGHIKRETSTETILIDTHNQRVCDDVWDLYEYALKRLGDRPTLIEWDQDFPPLQTLLDEAAHARDIIKQNVSKAKNNAA